jgi:hypothetical protein
MTKKNLFLIFVSIAVVILLASACNNNKEDEQKSPEMVYTEAAQTVIAKMTSMASEGELSQTPTPEPEVDTTAAQDDSITTATKAVDDETLETPTKTPQLPTQPVNCSLAAEYVADITIPDDTIVSTGETFNKTWQIMNSGTCTWGTGYTIYFVSGDDLSAPTEVSMTRGVEVPGGTMINVSISLTAPAEPGTYRADFKFKDANGKIFGTGGNGNGTVYVQVVVVQPTSTPTNTPPPTQTAAPTLTVTPAPTDS